MFTSLKVNNFRCFQSFELQELGTINLLVGANNSGKTSLLEAIQLLCSPRVFYSLQESMDFRGEYFLGKPDRRGNHQYELDTRHLFYGRKFNLDSKFSIEGIINDNIKESLVASIEERREEAQENFYYEYKLDAKAPYLYFNKSGTEEIYGSLLSPNGGMLIKPTRGEELETQLLRPFSLEISKLIALFDEVVLTPKEDWVLEALQIIEPKIGRIASVAPHNYGKLSTSLGQKGGFMVKFSDKEKPIPIGNLGDGIWRLLAIILAMISCKDGVFLVDEIDSGLHHTTMSEMWQLVWKIAKKLNIQVFATTHSDDCWRSLADVILEEKLTGENGSNEIRIHRIETRKNQSVVFIEPEIVIADNRDIEVR